METSIAQDIGSSSTHTEGVWLNDLHSQLNLTRACRIERPGTLEELLVVINESRRLDLPIIAYGGRHAMGAQQFGTEAVALNMTGLNRVLGLDLETGIIDLQAGITWTELQAYLDESRADHGTSAGVHGWAIAQKQTGADDLTLGGSVSSNVHGRGLNKRPIIEDIESLTLVNPQGQVVVCDRRDYADLFRVVIGGYGLFGIVYSVRLRLVPRQRVERIVRISDANSLLDQFDDRITSGCLFGDFQFQIDDQADDFLDRGIFACYRPVREELINLDEAPSLKRRDWLNLLRLAHVDKSAGFQAYQRHYLRTDGSQHWTDSHQFSIYVNGYHEEIDRCLGSQVRGSELITELYVPRPLLPRFLRNAREDLRRLGASVIYGTVRLIKEDTESYLPWATEPWACVIFNLCVEHSPAGLSRARDTFRQLIDRALELDGSYYLTYHKFARRDQIEAAYPMFVEFLKLKKELDPEDRIQSDWYRHHRKIFSDVL